MKKKVIVIVGIFLICMPMLLGVEPIQDELPVEKTFSINNFNDEFEEQWEKRVFVKEEQSYRRRARNVHIVAKPRLKGKHKINNEFKENPEHFLEIYITIDINFVNQIESSDEPIFDKNTLKYEKCEKFGKAQLFWGNETEDMGNQDALIWTIRDDYFEIKVTPIDFSATSFNCIPDQEQYCEPEDCLVYMDSVTLEVTVDYLPIQKDIKEAQQYEDKAEGFFQNGNYEKAKQNYENAKKIYENLGDIEIADEIQKKIDRIYGQMKFNEGKYLFNETGNIEDAKEAKAKFEEAKQYFTDIDDTNKAQECQDWIDKCKEKIDAPKSESETEKITDFKRNSKIIKILLYVGIGIAVALSAGVAVTQIQKKKSKTTVRRPTTIKEPTKPVEKGPRLIIGDQTFDITTDSMTIGRGKNADLQIEDHRKLISRIHAKIYRDERGQFWIRDNHSANGTYIYEDGTYKRIKKWLLYDGDIIALSYDSSRGAYVTIQFRSQ